MAGSEDLSREQSQQPRWNRIAERGSLWGLRFTLTCYRLFGRRLTLPLVHAIVTYFFLTDASGRRASLAYLKRVHAAAGGSKALDGPPKLRHCYRHYRTFALAIVDRLAIWLGSGEEFEFESEGMERFDRLAEERRGAIIVGAHLGSFDALRLLARRMNATVNVLMYTVNAPLINMIFNELSPDSEARVIAADPDSLQAVFAVRECLRRGEHVAILGDRVDPENKSRVSTVTLLGGSVQLPQAPVLLAAALGCPLILTLALRSAPGRYRAIAETLAESIKLPRRRERDSAVKELLETYSSRVEYYCTQAPYQWFNFFDYWGELGDADEPR
jgi:predicted LPLAT superfamily acyltransferase